MVIIPFQQDYVGREDHTLEDHLDRELPGILLWTLECLRKLRLRGKFTQPARGVSFRKDFDDASSPVNAFVRECCEMDHDFAESKNVLRRALNLWLQNNGHNALSANVVTTRLRAINSRIVTRKPRESGGRSPSYMGIRLNAETRASIRKDMA